MALECLNGFSKRNFRTETFGCPQDEDNLDVEQELATAFPNAVEPMSILTPPFVSLALFRIVCSIVHKVMCYYVF